MIRQVLAKVVANIGATIKVYRSSVAPAWQVPEGFFRRSDDSIVHGLALNHDNIQQAMACVDSYTNGCADLSTQHPKIERVRAKLREHYNSAS